MGELIRKVSELKIGNETFAVELNECTMIQDTKIFIFRMISSD